MDYQSNSKKNKEKEEQKSEKPTKPEIEKVVTGEVVVKSKNIGRKFRDVFFGGTLKAASIFVVGDVLLPALRDLFVDTMSRGSERLVWGDKRRRPPIQDYRPRVSYTDAFARTVVRDARGDLRDPRDRARLPDQNPYRQGRRDSNIYIVESREEADEVVERLYDCVNQYDQVSLADLHEMLGRPTSPIENKWGWTYLSKVSVRQVRDGWQIELPDMEAIT